MTKPEELTEAVLQIPSKFRKGSNLFFLHVHVLPRMCIATSIRALSVLLKVLNNVCCALAATARSRRDKCRNEVR